MAIILNIETSVDTASVCLAGDTQALALKVNTERRDHAGWLHVAIEQAIAEAGMGIKELDAVAVTMGPGSYTGLRIGLATAKGLCFALGVPMIGLSTLEVMATATFEEEGENLVPMIDARRMEVFTACYNKKLEPVMAPCAMILQAGSFDSLLHSGRTIFSGNGSGKLKKLVEHPNAVFSNISTTAINMMQLAENNFMAKKFADVAYAEPFYIKEFYSTAK